MAMQPRQVGVLSREEALDRIVALLASDDTESVSTSMRLPASLREAMAIAVDELGLSISSGVLTAQSLRYALSTAVAMEALELHFQQYPELRPTLGELAVAAAEMDGHPLAEEPEVLHRAADQIVAFRPEADPDDVLLWADAQRALEP